MAARSQLGAAFLVGDPEGLGRFELPAIGKAVAVAAPVLPGQRREDR